MRSKPPAQVAHRDRLVTAGREWPGADTGSWMPYPHAVKPDELVVPGEKSGWRQLELCDYVEGP